MKEILQRAAHKKADSAAKAAAALQYQARLDAQVYMLLNPEKAAKVDPVAAARAEYQKKLAQSSKNVLAILSASAAKRAEPPTITQRISGILKPLQAKFWRE